MILRHVRGRAADTVTIATIGVDIVLATELARQIGQDVLNLGDPWGSDVVRVGDFSIPEARVAAAVVALVLLGAFLAAFKFSPWGVAMRAAAEDARGRGADGHPAPARRGRRVVRRRRARRGRRRSS